MYEPEATHKHRKAHHQRAACCVESECLTGQRNNYFVGKRLTPDSFRVEQTYLNDRRHLLNRAIHGWGVVYGYSVAGDRASERIGIGGGLALDAVGRELLQVDDLRLALDDVIALDASGVPRRRDCDERVPPWSCDPCWLLRVHYAEQRIGQIDVHDPCSCERLEWDKVCETVRFSLQPIKCEECCRKPECELCCECGTGCCEKWRLEDEKRAEEQAADRVDGQDEGGREERHTEHKRGCCEEHDKEHPRCPENPVMRGECQCLCKHLAHLDVDVECTGLTKVAEPCGDVYVDLNNGVPLACVKLKRGDCDDWTFNFDGIDACGPRRLVKRNDLLFDLIRGCDLTRIVDTGWTHLHRAKDPVEWEHFQDSWGPAVEQNQRTRYWVEFSHPVRKSTVRPDCFAITVIEAEEEGGWGGLLRVPISGVHLEDAPGWPEHVIRADIIVDAQWVKDAIYSSKNRFNYAGPTVEIEVRGDYIIDCNGQAVDAEAVGLLAVPTGDGAPGGRYLSTFRVKPRPRPQRGEGVVA